MLRILVQEMAGRTSRPDLCGIISLDCRSENGFYRMTY